MRKSRNWNFLKIENLGNRKMLHAHMLLKFNKWVIIKNHNNIVVKQLQAKTFLTLCSATLTYAYKWNANTKI